MVLHLALEVDGAGAHPGAASATSVPLDRLLSADHLRRTVAAAENAGVTFVTFDDALVGPARVDAVTRAAFVAPLTSRIGLVPLAHPGVTEPFHLASQVAALDHATTGRSGWLVGSGPVPGARAALDRPVADGQDLLDETADVVRVVRDLWDSWDDDAVIRDTATGRYIDRDRLHYVDFTSGGTGPVRRPGPARRARRRSRAVHRQGSAHRAARPPGPAGGGRPGRDRAARPGRHRARRRAARRPGRRGRSSTCTSRSTPPTRRPPTGSPPWRTSRPPATCCGGPARPTGSSSSCCRCAARSTGSGCSRRVLEEDLPVLVRWVLPALRVARATPTPRPGATLRDTLGLPRPTSRFATLQETS